MHEASPSRPFEPFRRARPGAFAAVQPTAPIRHGRVAGSLTPQQQLHPNKHSGRFSCEVCGTKILTWSGNYDFFGWKVDQVKSPSFGKKVGMKQRAQTVGNDVIAAERRIEKLEAELAELRNRLDSERGTRQLRAVPPAMIA